MQHPNKNKIGKITMGDLCRPDESLTCLISTITYTESDISPKISDALDLLSVSTDYPLTKYKKRFIWGPLDPNDCTPYGMNQYVETKYVYKYM